jgi:uncharacterized membrane protein
MDDLVYQTLTLLLIAFFVSAVLGGISFFQHRVLRRQVADLQARLDRLAVIPTAATEAMPIAEAPAAVETPVIAEAPEIEAPVVPDAEPEAQPPPPPPVPEPAAPPPRDDGRRIEEAIGARWAVWVGGVAIALGGIFLVRYSIEAGLLGPGPRIVLALILGAVLVAAGEWLRRRTPEPEGETQRSAYIPGILTAAGTTVAFAAVYAAYAVFDFIGPAGAFVALGALALVTMAFALLHGPALAGLGLVASYVTPFLVSSAEPALAPLALFLVIVAAAALGLARLRNWRWLAVSAALGAMLWGATMVVMSGGASGPDITILALYIAATFALAFAVFVVASHPAAAINPASGTDLLAVGVLSSFLLPIVFMLVLDGSGPTSLMLAVAIGALMVAGAAEWPAVRHLAVAATVLVLFAYAIFDAPVADMVKDPLALSPDVDMLVASTRWNAFLGTGAVLALLFGGLGLFGTLRSSGAGALAVAGTAIPLGLFVIAYLRVAEFETSRGFGLAALFLALLFGALTESLIRLLPPGRKGTDAGIAAYAVATVAALAAGVTILSERGVLTLALVLIVPAIAAIERARPVKALRPIALVLAAIVVLRFMFDPRVVGADVGTRPFFNWLLWGYGVPALAFGLAAYLFARTRPGRTVEVMQALSVIFTALTAGLVLHHWVNNGDVFAPVSGLLDQSLLTLVSLSVALGLQRIALRNASPVFVHGTMIAGGIAAVLMIAGHLVLWNPWLTGEPIGVHPVVNLLLPGYLLPAVLAGLVAVTAQQAGRRREYVQAAWWLSGIFAAEWATLEIRGAFHRPVLAGPPIGDVELYAYSAAWLAIGIALLALGLALRSRQLRMVSAGVVMLVVAKVFLVDMSELTGLLRALSFLGLGAILIAVALVYQRLIFRIGRDEAARPA